MTGDKIILPRNASDLLNPARRADMQRATDILNAYQNLRLTISGGGSYSSSVIQIAKGAALLSGNASIDNPQVTLTWTSEAPAAVSTEWTIGPATGTLTLQNTDLVAGGSAISDYAGDGWLFRSSLNGSFITGTSSVQSTAPNQTLTISPFTFSAFTTGSQLSAAMFSSNGGVAPVYISHFGVSLVYNLFCSDLISGHHYTVTTALAYADVGGGHERTGSDSFSFAADAAAMTITRIIAIDPNGYAPAGGLPVTWQNVIPFNPIIRAGG